MSINSGFATRALEASYNSLLSKILSLLHAHAIASIRCRNSYTETIDYQA